MVDKGWPSVLTDKKLSQTFSVVLGRGVIQFEDTQFLMLIEWEK